MSPKRSSPSTSIATSLHLTPPPPGKHQNHHLFLSSTLTMDQILEGLLENALEKVKLKYGLMLATGHLRWKATREVQATFWRTLNDHMATCDLNVVHEEGVRVYCRLMYTKHGFCLPTRGNGGPSVKYVEISGAFW